MRQLLPAAGIGKERSARLVAVIIFGIVELFAIARWRTGVFDPRCMLPRSYVLAHTYTKRQEVVRCVHDAP
jgi:hypothetical protein